MDEFKLKELLERYNNGTCTNEEQKLLFRFFDSFQVKNDLWEKIGIKEKNRIHIELSNKLNSKINALEKRQHTNNFILWKTAAAILLIIGLGVLSFFIIEKDPELKLIVKSTTKGQKLNIKLADGSKVILNSESSIQFPEKFTKSRDIILQGEAFFEVKKNGKPFKVITDEITTKVMGTTFNVKAYPNSELQVTLSTGKVSINSLTDSLILNPGDQANFNVVSKKLTVEKVQLDRFTSWKDGILIFDNNTLPEIATILSQWYNVEIFFKDTQLAKCQLKLKFDNMSLREVLEQIKTVTGIEYQFITNNKIEIKGSGCLN